MYTVTYKYLDYMEYYTYFLQYNSTLQMLKTKSANFKLLVITLLQ